MIWFVILESCQEMPQLNQRKPASTLPDTIFVHILVRHFNSTTYHNLNACSGETKHCCFFRDWTKLFDILFQRPPILISEAALLKVTTVGHIDGATTLLHDCARHRNEDEAGLLDIRSEQ